MKISKQAKDDFNFYVNFRGTFGLGDQEKSKLDPNGVIALEAWYSKDTFGKLVPTKEPELFDRAIEGKMNVNLQLKQWAEGLAEGTFQLFEFVHYMTEKNWPKWCHRALRNYGEKLKAERIKAGRIWPWDISILEGVNTSEAAMLRIPPQ